MMRQEFTKTTQKAALARANGHCEGCGLPLEADRRPEYHHRIEAWLGGDNSLENCQVLCIPCHKATTKKRAPVLAKVQRILDKKAGIRGPSRWPKRRFGT